MVTKERTKIALIMLASSISVSCVIGLLLAVVATVTGKPFWSSLLFMVEMCYFMFGAWCTLAALLILLTPIPNDLALGYGGGLFYGTIFLGRWLSNRAGSEKPLFYGIAFVICALVGYIMWLKMFKDKYRET